MNDTYLNHYKLDLIDEHIIGSRLYYDAKIIDTLTNNSIIISDFSPSPLDTNIFDSCMLFIVRMALEWYEDQRDDGDGQFQEVYNKLHEVMNDEDIQELDLYFYDIENEGDL